MVGTSRPLFAIINGILKKTLKTSHIELPINLNCFATVSTPSLLVQGANGSNKCVRSGDKSKICERTKMDTESTMLILRSLLLPEIDKAKGTPIGLGKSWGSRNRLVSPYLCIHPYPLFDVHALLSVDRFALHGKEELLGTGTSEA